MAKVLRSGDTAERFVATALELIAEHGGSGQVNLRQVAKRLGCAHTNLYNYYASYPELLWEAFRRTLVVYRDWLVRDLDDSLSPDAYLRRVLENLATFPQAHPGLYRFIASDRLPTEDIPRDVLEAVGAMKRWLAAACAAGSATVIRSADATTIADIVLAYVDGETLNLINERLVPGEDIAARIVDNALRLHRLLVLDARSADPADEAHPARTHYPTLDIPIDHRGG